MKSDYPSLDGAECPFPFYEKARAECPVSKIDGHNAHFVTRYDDVKYVLQHTELFSNIARGVGVQPAPAKRLKSGVEARGLNDSDPPESLEHRKLATRKLTPRGFQEYAPKIRAHVDALIDGFIDDGKCEFIEQFAFLLPALVITDVLGLPPNFLHDLRRWGQIETTAIVFFPENQKQRQFDTLQTLKDFSRQQLIDRYNNPSDDALGQLVRDQIARDGEFDVDYLIQHTAILVSGGIITTGHHLGMTLRLLIEHPEQMQAVMNDRKLIPQMLEESLRLQAPVQWIPRRVVKDTELNGVQLTAGGHILAGLGSAARDGKQFKDPDSFDIYRDNITDHMAFGFGVHRCIGAVLSRIEATVTFERMFDRMKNIRLSADNDFTHIKSPQMRGLNKLNIEFERR